MKNYFAYLIIPFIAIIMFIGFDLFNTANKQIEKSVEKIAMVSYTPTPTPIPTPTPNLPVKIETKPATISGQVAGAATAKFMSPVTLKTDLGNIVIELSTETKKTSQNFYDLAKKGFYNNVIFHRVIRGFMIQGGDPTGTGTGGPGYQFADEPFTGSYTRGTVAMANSGPNTNGSQFFIMHKDYPLPPNYTIFGHVTAGLDVVDQIAEAPTGPNDRPINPVKILSTEVVE